MSRTVLGGSTSLSFQGRLTLKLVIYLMLKPNPQSDGFRRWDLLEMIRSWGWSPRGCDECPYKRDPPPQKKGVPNVVQWVKILTAASLVAAEVRLWAWCRLIQHCCSCGLGCSCSSDSIPGPGIFICCGHSHEKKKRREKSKSEPGRAPAHLPPSVHTRRSWTVCVPRSRSSPVTKFLVPQSQTY